MNKRFLSLILAMVLVLTALPTAALAADVVASGTCGENLTWELTSDGVLTIAGTGEMYDYRNYEADSNLPWAEYTNSITSVVIGRGATSIGEMAFSNCTALANVDIPDSITQIGYSAFWECREVESITIPGNVTYIGETAFYGCVGLKEVVIPDSVTEIGYGAFWGCTGLTSVRIPSSVISIDFCPFGNCSRLNTIDVDADNPNYRSENGVLFGKISTNLIQAPGALRGKYTIPDGTGSISYGAFGNTDGLTSVVFPESMNYIGDEAFWGCTNLSEIVFKGDAFLIRNGAFGQVTANVYYPENNDTWTEEYLQDYGGTLTWVAGLPEDSPTENFSDVSDTDYFYAPVLWAYTNNITTGTTPTTFSPNNACTRAQIVTFLWRAMGEPEPQSNTTPFTDLDKNEYYYKAVLWAVEEGITTGMSATTFEPNRACTRSQAVTFQWRAAGCPTSSANNPFADIPTGQWYTEAVLWAVEQGITTGISADKFAPNNTCTRAHIVTFLYRNLSEN